MIDNRLEKKILQNIKWIAERDDTEAFDSFDLGQKRLPTYNTTRHTANGWDTSQSNQSKDNWVEYPDSLWIEARDYDPEVGIMTIYFKPLPTNAKSPVVLGIGDPIDWGFVHSFDNGLQSQGLGNAEGHARPNSQGKFYKEFIEQGRWVEKNGTMIYKPNTKRVVEAVTLEELEIKEKELKRMKDEGVIDEQGKKIQSPKISKIVNSIYHIPRKNFLKQLSVDKIKSDSKRYALNFIAKGFGYKNGNEMKNTLQKNVTKKIVDKLNLHQMVNKVKSYNGAKSELSRLVNKKGALNILRTSPGRNAAMRALGKGSSKALVSESAAEGMMASGAALAPETAGVSVVIAAGVSVALSIFKSHKHIDRMQKAVGKEALGAINVYAFKKVLQDEVKLHIKRVGVKDLLKGVKENKSLKWGELNKNGDLKTIYSRSQQILANRTNARGLWDIAKNDANKNRNKKNKWD